MSDQSGYVKIPRHAYESDPFWLEKRVFSRWEAWEWLVQAASWKDRDWCSGGSTRAIRLERGETPPLSARYLGTVWGWDKMRVIRFMKSLGVTGMNKMRDSKRYSSGDTYIIVDYDTYSGSRDTERDTERDSSETAVRQVRDTQEERKESNTSLPTVERNTHTRTRAREGTPKSRASKRCPAEWAPKDDHRRLALSLGVDLTSSMEVMRDYTFATARSDWDATARNWIRKAAEMNGAAGGVQTTLGTLTGEDPGELQRRRQQEAQQLEAEHQNEKQAWKRAIAERWEAEEPAVRDRIRARAEAEFDSLRGDELRFKRAVDPRAVQLYAEEIKMPAPKKRTA